MPRLSDVVHVLRATRGRYRYLDAFVDDMEELRSSSEVAVRRIPGYTWPAVETWVDDQPLRIEIFAEEGVARFQLLDAPSPSGDTVGLGAALGGVLGAAAGVATEKKEGLLGGLVFGFLVGGLLGAAASQPAVERALALRFDPRSGTLKVYDQAL